MNNIYIEIVWYAVVVILTARATADVLIKHAYRDEIRRLKRELDALRGVRANSKPPPVSDATRAARGISGIDWLRFNDDVDRYNKSQEDQ